MLFVSAGHNTKISIKTGKIDPGAVGCGRNEADCTAIQRDLISAELKRFGAPFITDKDNESLGEYLERIKTGNGSVVFECHFDAASSPEATGCTAVVGRDADRLDKAFALELVNTTATILGIRNRGVISEEQTHRGSLGLMREQGIVALLEIGFITNCEDICKWELNKEALATAIARLLVRYDGLIQ